MQKLVEIIKYKVTLPESHRDNERIKNTQIIGIVNLIGIAHFMHFTFSPAKNTSY